VLEGFNGTIFAYGQTGAGKSWTMQGSDAQPGIIPRSFHDIFDQISARAGPGRQALVRASYLEIYNEGAWPRCVRAREVGRACAARNPPSLHTRHRSLTPAPSASNPRPHAPSSDVRDLLTRDPAAKALELKEHPEAGVYVKDLTSCVVKSAGEIEAILAAGQRNRSVGATLMNAQSSRSHSIFTVTVETSEEGDDGAAHIRVGKLNMVDLAGSERQSKTGATGTRLKEATKINLSLSALGNVISALVDGKASHIPYRVRVCAWTCVHARAHARVRFRVTCERARVRPLLACVSMGMSACLHT